MHIDQPRQPLPSSQHYSTSLRALQKGEEEAATLGLGHLGLEAGVIQEQRPQGEPWHFQRGIGLIKKVRPFQLPPRNFKSGDMGRLLDPIAWVRGANGAIPRGEGMRHQLLRGQVCEKTTLMLATGPRPYLVFPFLGDAQGTAGAEQSWLDHIFLATPGHLTRGLRKERVVLPRFQRPTPELRGENQCREPVLCSINQKQKTTARHYSIL